MAYPSVDAPYGLKPVNLIGGLPFAGATRQFPITSNYGTSLFNGDVVQLDGNGAVIITTLSNDASAVPGVVGVFLGCSYTNPATKQKLFSQYYPANTVASDIVAYVCDDPNALFKVVSVTANTADGASTGLLPAFKSRAAAIPTNAELVLNTGLTATGNSRMGVYINNVATALPFRVVDVVAETANSSGNFVEFIVKFNAGYHTYNSAVGVA
jgi:hypothetical protein